MLVTNTPRSFFLPWIKGKKQAFKKAKTLAITHTWDMVWRFQRDLEPGFQRPAPGWLDLSGCRRAADLTGPGPL
jgi:hypothetical protein